MNGISYTGLLSELHSSKCQGLDQNSSNTIRSKQASTLLQYSFTIPHSLEMCNSVTKKKCLHKVHTDIHNYTLYVHPINSTGLFRFILREVTTLYEHSILEGHDTVQLVSLSHTMYVCISLTTASIKLRRGCMFRFFHQYRKRINSFHRNNTLYMHVKYK